MMILISLIPGYIEAVDAMAIGKSVVLLGGGRQLPEDPIDPAVGIKLLMTKGDKVCGMWVVLFLTSLIKFLSD